MKTSRLGTLVSLACLAFAPLANAIPLSANFSDYPDAPTSFGFVDLDTVAANTWFNEHYGITFENAYLYYDERDTFDHLGIALDELSLFGAILFADGTNFVWVDWVTLVEDIFLEAYDGNGMLVASFHQGGLEEGDTGSALLTGTNIRRLVFHDGGGQIGLSTLDYDFDGKTDGQNTDTGGGTGPNDPGVPGVPDSATTLGLLAGSCGVLALLRRRR